jgi:hypothetical protein
MPGCASIGAQHTVSSLPAAAAAAPATRSTVPQPGTLFVDIFAGALPGSIEFTAPPYTSGGSTQALQTPVNIALTRSNALIVVANATPGPLSIIRPPYTGNPVTIDRVFWAGGMALDQNDDIFLAERTGPHSDATYLEEYLAPDYKHSITFSPEKGRYIGSVLALPNGLLAVGSVRDGAQRSSLPGNLAIYRPPYTHRPVKIAALSYVSAMTVVPEGLIVAVCAQCYSSKAGGTYLALVAPPYTAVTKVLVTLPNVSASAMTSTALGDVFVKQDSWLYRYRPPYSKGEKLPKTAGALESMTTAANGDLFFGALSEGNQGQFAVDTLSSPYTAEPHTIFNAFGPPTQMTVAR